MLWGYHLKILIEHFNFLNRTLNPCRTIMPITIYLNVFFKNEYRIPKKILIEGVFISISRI